MSYGGEPMKGDNLETAINRYYVLLHWQLAAQLPRPGGAHIYSHGGLISGFTTRREGNGWVLTISNGIDYGSYAMGFRDDGTRRTPRGDLERLNFSTIDKTIENVSRLVAVPTGGKVVISK